MDNPQAYRLRNAQLFRRAVALHGTPRVRWSDYAGWLLCALLAAAAWGGVIAMMCW
jgi:hypothetical protein